MLFDIIPLELFSHTENWKRYGELFLHDHFFMLRRFRLHDKYFLQTSQPYRLREGRVVHVRRGYADYSFDLVDYHFKAGDLVVFFADILIEKQGHSADFEFDAFSFDSDAYRAASAAVEPVSFIRLHLNETTRPVINQYFTLMWSVVHSTPFPADNVELLTNSLLLYVSRQHLQTANRPANRQQDTLQRFVELVSRHAASERSIPFYADLLHLAPHYLSTLVKQASGRTVMQWINQTAIKEIKVWLAYSDDSAAQIADHLHFPSPSSLCKFFKRETGMTPGEYRRLCR